jgi:hypothetical protein
MAFEEFLTTTVDIVKNVPTKDGLKAPVANWTTVVHAKVQAGVYDHRPKLHGDQEVYFDQPIINAQHDIFVLGLFYDLGSGNGYGVRFDKTTANPTGTFARITYIQRFRQVEDIPDCAMIVCEETGS